MKTQKNIKKRLCLFFTCVLLMASNTNAVDITVLQEQCAEIGFKIRTPANGKCVLKLMKSVNVREVSEQKAKVDAEKAREEESRLRDADIAQARALNQHQEEMMDLQRRGVVAQEQATKAQNKNNGPSASSVIVCLFVSWVGCFL